MEAPFVSIILFEVITNNCIVLLAVSNIYWDWAQSKSNPYFHLKSSFGIVLFLIASKALKADCNSFDR